MDTPPELSTAVVSHTRPPATTGDDQPRPGTGVRHATFRPSPHSNGRFFSVECPSPPGPRNCGQSSARSPALHAAKTRINKGRNRARFVKPYRLTWTVTPPLWPPRWSSPGETSLTHSASPAL